MKFNYKGRGFAVLALSAMLVAVGTANYQLSKKSLIETSNELKDYEQAQKTAEITDEILVVDSKKEEATETSKQIEEQIASKSNMGTYILDMKMNREKQRNQLSQELNEMINNPSTTEEARKEASSMKLQIVKDQETESRIENILSTKGFENSLVYINEGKVNVVVSNEKLEKSDAAKIFDLVSKEASVDYENIKLSNSEQ